MVLSHCSIPFHARKVDSLGRFDQNGTRGENEVATRGPRPEVRFERRVVKGRSNSVLKEADDRLGST